MQWKQKNQPTPNQIQIVTNNDINNTDDEYVTDIPINHNSTDDNINTKSYISVLNNNENNVQQNNINNRRNISRLKIINRDIRQMINNNEIGEINIGRINEILQRRYQFDYREFNSQSMLQFLMKHHKSCIKSTRSGIIYINQ